MSAEARKEISDQSLIAPVDQKLGGVSVYLIIAALFGRATRLGTQTFVFGISDLY